MQSDLYNSLVGELIDTKFGKCEVLDIYYDEDNNVNYMVLETENEDHLKVVYEK